MYVEGLFAILKLVKTLFANQCCQGESVHHGKLKSRLENAFDFERFSAFVDLFLTAREFTMR